MAIAALLASTAGAQQSQSHRTAALDVTFARHAVRGGFIDFRTGALLDILVAANLQSTPRSSLVAAFGAGAVLGGFGDRCLVRPDGGCAPQGNFAVFNLLAGVDRSLGIASLRALVGPALYNGASDTSIGAQGRVDLGLPVFSHVGMGAMTRVTVLPSHGGERLVAWAVGGSLTVR